MFMIYIYNWKNNIERVPYITEDLPYTIIFKKKNCKIYKAWEQM